MSMDDFIPAGFVPLANWDSRNRRHNDGHSIEWKTLSDAVKDGEIPGFKLSNGRWYVHDKKATEFLARAVEPLADGSAKARQQTCRERVDSSQQLEALLCALSALVTNQTTTLHAIERIADAVERIASQPLARLDDIAISDPGTSGPWRDMNGEHCN